MSKPRRITIEEGAIWHGALEQVLPLLPEKSVDLVIGSPPYSNARLYLEDGKDIGIARDTKDWVQWMADKVYPACLRVSKGLVCMVVGHGSGSKTWSAAPALLCAALLEKGINLRSPLFYHRHGIIGGGGPDWFRPDVEWIICAGPRDLDWSDNTACGHPPKYDPGGQISHRNQNGSRVNNKAGLPAEAYAELKQLMAEEGLSKKQAALKLGYGAEGREITRTSGIEGGNRCSSGVYVPPEKANPGNVLFCKGGGGHLGSNIAHENEAPFAAAVPRFFIKSFCPPDGTILDPFGGSGTSAAEAIKLRRRFITCDIRLSQIKLILRRIKQARLQRGLF